MNSRRQSREGRSWQSRILPPVRWFGGPRARYLTTPAAGASVKSLSDGKDLLLDFARAGRFTFSAMHLTATYLVRLPLALAGLLFPRAAS